MNTVSDPPSALRHDLMFGSFLTPTAAQAADVVALAQLSDQVGLDLVTFQDHPYQAAFLDSWTLLSYIAASTSRVRLSLNVANLPLRPPVVLARSAASLDLLSGGRLELGLGAGAFWDAIVAAGGRRLSPAEAVVALEEAISVIRQVWDTTQRGGVRLDGRFHQVQGAKRGPAPAHDIGIWVGAYKPRMLQLTGRLADGWLPSLGYLPGGPSDLAGMNADIDAAAAEVGRPPSDIRRMLNVSGRFSAQSGGLLDGPAAQWIEELAYIALEYGISTFILGSDNPADLAAFGEEVAPGVRELVDAERAAPPRADAPAAAVTGIPTAGTATTATTTKPTTAPTTAEALTDGTGAAVTTSGSEPVVPPGLRVTPTPSPASTWSDERVWDESTRPAGPPPPTGFVYSAQAQQVGQHLVDVHDHLRGELEQLRDVLRQVRQGVLTAGSARAALNEMTMRQNNWTLGAFCASYCRLVSQHHHIEDSAVFPHLRRADTGLAPVIDRLEAEHVVIHDVVEGVDRELVTYISEPSDFSPIQRAVDLLTDTLLSHLAYEESQIIEPLARLGFYAGQI